MAQRPDPEERLIAHWRGVALQAGMTRERLKESMEEELDPEDVERILPQVIGAVTARTTVRPAQQQGGTRTPATPIPDPTSPYRFVTLNGIVLPAPQPVRAGNLDRPLTDGYSGTITVEWVAKTPILIGDEQGDEIRPLRLGANGPHVIPGATIKGLLRAGVETVTLGRLTQINREHRFGLRDFQDDRYRRDPATGNARLAWGVIKAGWLHKNPASPGGYNYCITECDKRTIRIRDLPPGFTAGPSAGARQLNWLRASATAKYRAVGMGALDFSPGTAQGFSASAGNPDDVLPAPSGKAGTLSGFYVFSGPLPLPRGQDAALITLLDQEDSQRGPGLKKKREYVFLDRPGSVSHPVPQTVFDNFDRIHSIPGGRDWKPNGVWENFKRVLEAGGRIPVFILGNLTDEHFDIGLTRAFKIAHDNSVGQVLDLQTGRCHRPKRDLSNPDWAEALFGHVFEDDDFDTPLAAGASATPPEDLARKGRVAVGFAHAITPARLFPQPPAAAIQTTMMAPRASFAPHYLVGPVKHWSDIQPGPGVGLAGRKRYFPRFAGGGQTDAQNLIQRDHTLPGGVSQDTISRLRFLVSGNNEQLRFRGKIHLHNVLKEEIGAILWVLTLGGQPGLCHMIGRAKPFGAGQVEAVVTSLDLVPHKPGPTPSVADCIAAFEDAMDKTARVARLPGSWRNLPQVAEFLALADPAAGATERDRGHSYYPGAQQGAAPTLGMDMSKGPGIHQNLRKAVTRSGPARFLSPPRRPLA